MHVRRMLALSVLLTLAPLGALVIADGFDHGLVLRAQLTGDEEVPPTLQGGSPSWRTKSRSS